MSESLTIGHGLAADADAVADLVVEAHGPYYRFCFSGGDEAFLHPFVRAAVADERSELFVSRAIVARLGDEVAGVVAASVAAERAAFGRRDAYLLRAVLPRVVADRTFRRMRQAADMFAAPSPNSLYLARVAVAPGVRGQGVGARLLDVMKQRASSDGLSALELHVAASNEAGRRFYERAGFCVIHRATSAVAGLPDYLQMYCPAVPATREDDR